MDLLQRLYELATSRWPMVLFAVWSAASITLNDLHRAASENAAHPTTPSSIAAQRSAYSVILLSSLKGSLASGDPSQLPSIVLNSNFGQKQRLPKVEFDRSNPTQMVAWVTYLGLEDDSVKDIRYRIEMIPSSSLCACQSWKISWMGQQYRCQAGRGAQDWSAQLCR
jgi:hypothetical protein